MIILGCVTDEISNDIKKAIELGSQHGIRNFELRWINKNRFPLYSDDEIKFIINQIENNDINITAVSPGSFKLDISTDLATYTNRILSLTKMFKTYRIIVFAKKECRNKDEYRDMIKKLQSLCKKASNHGIYVYLENSAGTCCNNVSAALRIISDTGEENLRLNWDPANMALCGEFDQQKAYLSLKDHIGNLHIKDVAFDESKNPVFVPVGCGIIDYETILTAMIKDGYEGVVTIETHIKPAYPAFVKSLVHIQHILKSIGIEVYS